MANETFYQRQLIDAAETLGGYGQKLSNRFLAGVPDLMLQVPASPTLIAEVKQKEVTDTTKLVRVELTKLQHDKLTRHQKAGGHAGWIMVAHTRYGEKWVMASTDLTEKQPVFTFTVFKELSCHMRRSDPWTKPLQYLLPILSARR